MREKVIVVPCGEGSQRVKWLGHVAIARWDEANYQGWKELGACSALSSPSHESVALVTGQPTAVLRQDGEEIDLGFAIKDTLEDGDTVVVKHSLEREWFLRFSRSRRARGNC